MAEIGALADLRVLDLSDETGRLAGKLLAEAGASVLRLRPGEPGPPMSGATAARGGLLDWWFEGGARALPLDLERATDRATFRDLAARADLLIETEAPGRLASLGLEHAALAGASPRLTHVSLTPFGQAGPRSAWATSDLVSAALGGVLSVNGAPEAPLNGWGRQTGVVGGLYAAICGLAGVRAARISGQGSHYDLSLHEAVIACTEQVLMYWFFQDRLPRAIAQRQRALHWSGLYDVLTCRDGHVMVTPASDLPGQLDWLAEEGISGFEDMLTPGPMVAARAPAFMAAMRGWVAPKAAEPLFLEGQRRGLPYGLVQGIAQAARTPQLLARDLFRPVRWYGPAVLIPGPLVRLPDTPAPAAAPPPAAPVRPAEALAAWPYRAADFTDARRAAAAPQGSRPTPPDDPATTAEPVLSEPSAPSESPAAAVEQRAAAIRATTASLRPLAGLRVLDFTWVLAGPFATRILAELGAEVIKIQTETRSQGTNSNESAYFMMWNRGKESVTLNMKHPRAVETFRRLVEQSDIVIENFSAGVLERWGIGYETARAWNERLIYLSMSGCGKTGPWRDFVSYAPTIHALTGLTALTGHPGERDCGYGLSYNDHASGLAGTLALLEALHVRAQSGRGQFIDLSQLEVGAFLTGPAFVEHLNSGREAVAAGNRDPFSDPVPNDVYRCADGGWLAVTARDDADWQRLRAVIADPALADPRLAAVAGRREQREMVDTRLAAWALAQQAPAAMRALQAAGVPAGVVQTAQDFTETDEQLAARGWLAHLEHPSVGVIPVDRFPARVDGAPLPLPSPPPGFGEHTFSVYGALLGLSDEEVAAAIGDGLFL